MITNREVRDPLARVFDNDIAHRDVAALVDKEQAGARPANCREDFALAIDCCPFPQSRYFSRLEPRLASPMSCGTS